MAWQYGVSCMEVSSVKEAIVSVGSATISAIIASALATLIWWIAARLNAPAWACMFLFGLFLALVIVAGPLIKLP